jgi:hypothetical protein
LNPYTVLACEAVGARVTREKPVVVTPATTLDIVPAAAVVGETTTNGTDGSVLPNVTETSVPAAVLPSEPQVRAPRTIVEAEFTTGAGGAVPAPAPAAAVTVDESHGL